MTEVEVPGAGVTQSQAVTSVVHKKPTAATPAATAVPVILVPAATPATTVPAVAVSGRLQHVTPLPPFTCPTAIAVPISRVSSLVITFWHGFCFSMRLNLIIQERLLMWIAPYTIDHLPSEHRSVW